MASDPSLQDSESPMVEQQGSDSPTSTTRKARRQTAFYPNTANKPQKPFSRSAAKRESVMALGSIEHLQHYFTKTGLVARKNPLKPNSNLVPAIGPGLIQADTFQDSNIILPPSPMAPPPFRPTLPPFVKTYQTDPELLKPGVIEDLEAVEHAWSLGQINSKPRDPELLGGDPRSFTSGDFDVLSVLKTTTRTIRSVRNYLVSLPDDFATPRPPAMEFRPQSLSPPTATARKVSQPDFPNDPLTLIRRSALEVLTVLRNLEEVSRIPLSDDVYEVQSDAGSSSTRSHTPGGTERVASPFTTISGDDDDESNGSCSFSIVKVPCQKNSILVWSDDEESEGDDDTEERKRWDERLVLGGGWLYKQNLSVDILTKERDAVRRYLDAADQTLFGGRDQDGRRGWEKEKRRLAAEKEKEARSNKARRASAGAGEGQGLSPRTSGRARRVVSAGMIDAMRDMMVSEEPEDVLHSVMEEDEEGEDGVDDDELPDWAKRSKFVDDPLARLLSLLVALLPSELLPLLPPPSNIDKSTLVYKLSSGQILCTAYNIAVRKSRKPWGYITPAAIHDIAMLESQASDDAEADKEKKRNGWTFRRTDNLRLWAAALKLRYMVPIGPPKNSQGNTPMASPSANQLSFPSFEHMLLFDPQLVAKREEGWDNMLEAAVLKWMWCVVGERRTGN
ncbi:hypothetical protein JB92DRAFT_2786835 [Gautieria morchelliformis]|nr:hypothetical protein JB92DRAFT_2786835 [Gautieria morchelliformis]